MAKREIVVPGDLLDDSGNLKPGPNTYKEGGKVYAARLGVKQVRGDRLHVISLSGRYEAHRGDLVIGTVIETGPSNWYIDIGAAHDVGMHVNDVPWRVEFGETDRYLAVGDTVLLKIYHVDELRRVQVSMKDRQCRKLQGGSLVEVAPVKVPRIIGRGGSMIGQIKDATNTRILAGQNGVIWIDGEPEEVAIATEAIRKVEAEAHTSGLTDRMKAWLDEQTKALNKGKTPSALEEKAEPQDSWDPTPVGEEMEAGSGAVKTEIQVDEDIDVDEDSEETVNEPEAEGEAPEAEKEA